MPTERKRIAIIGGGASGTLLAARAVQELRGADIHLIERTGHFGPGLAYGVSDPCFLLNVPAEKMGGFPEHPAHFYEWMHDHPDSWRGLHPSFENVHYKASDFVPRMIYGSYLEYLLETAGYHAPKNDNTLELVHGHVTAVKPLAGEVKSPLEVYIKGAAPTEFDAVVFTSGNVVQRNPSKDQDHKFFSIYDPDTLNECLDDAHIIILGAGLSMVDTVHALAGYGFQGRITAISRNGLLPLSHTDHITSLPPLWDGSEGSSLTARQIIRHVRQAITGAIAQDISWQSVIDSLRPVSGNIWAHLPEKEQKRLRRIMPWWSIARHRIPDFIRDELDTMIQAGTLDIIKGHIAGIDIKNGAATVVLSDGRRIEGNRIFNCTGFDYSAEHIRTLCPGIEIKAHWSGTPTLASDQQHRLSAEYPVYAVGPMLSGYHFESTAINEIRKQVQSILGQL